MGVFVKLLQFVGCVNVLFIAFNNSYQFSSNYFSNATLMKTLIVLVLLSFAKDLFGYIGTATTESKPLYYLFRFVTILIPGILSSLVILIPKLIFIESQHLDSMMVKFTVRITRLWSKEELSLYLANLVEERGISELVSESDQSCIVERSSSMSELRNSLNALVNERSEALKSGIPNGMAEVQTIVQEPSWFSENTVLVVTVSVIAIAALVGIGYLLYTNSGNSEPTAGSVYDDAGLRDIEAKITQLNTLIESKGSSNVKEIVGLVKKEFRSNLESLEAEVIRLSAMSNELTNHPRKIAALIKQVEVLTDQADVLTKRADDLTRRANALTRRSKEFTDHNVAVSESIDALKASSKAVDIQLQRLKKGFSSQLETPKMEVGQEAARSFDSRITSLENSNLNMLESTSSFVKVMVEAAKSEILGSNEFVAMRTLLGDEVFREKLMGAEVKNLVGDIMGLDDATKKES